MSMQADRTDHLVRLAISLQILLATALLALGESSLLLPLATLVAIGLSVYLTDITGRVRLKQSVADVLALGVMLFSVVAALRSDRQELLIVVANLQTYLQFVLLFQQKSPRIYWQLALLTLGQVAIASTLVPGPIFGVLLLAYLLAGIVCFSLLLMRREMLKPARRHATGETSAAWRRPPQLVGAVAPLEGGVLLRGLLTTATAICALAVVAGGLFFLALPRWSVASFEMASTEPLRTVGFSKTVTLGDLGAVVNDPDVVMRVTFYRGRGNRPIRLVGEPLFRGTAVTRYEGRTWSQPLDSHSVLMSTEAGSTITRQRITIEPLDVSEVFCVAPPVAIDQPDPRLRLDRLTGQLLRSEESREHTQEFDIGTTGISGDRQRDLLACDRPPRPIELRAMLQPFASGIDSNPFPDIQALATRILADKNLDPQVDRLAAARALSAYFHESEEFFYSLEPQVREADLDPLEDFVTVHRAGHCEYFAGALVLMLRSQGIPARMVIGFKGGEWNELGNYYQVQQLHAHTWVEALLAQTIFPSERSQAKRCLGPPGWSSTPPRARRKTPVPWGLGCSAGCGNRSTTRRCCGSTMSPA